MILLGLDDTDMPDTRGTNQLARALAATLAPRYRCLRIVRHQLFFDSAIPFTSHNGSASLYLQPHGEHDAAWLFEACREQVRREAEPGSDPGLCLAESPPAEIVAFARRAKCEVVTQGEARALAQRHGVRLEGLGGTEGGVIGALAAVGLAATADDGRVIHLAGWEDDLTGRVPAARIAERGIAIRLYASGAAVRDGWVELPKKLRPNLVAGQVTLWVEPGESSAGEPAWNALRVL